MRDRGREYRIGPGAASLILIVVVLSMSVMGILALFSARNDLALAERGADMTHGIYEADGRVEARLAQLDALLKETLQGAGNYDAYIEAVAAALPEGYAMSGELITFSEDAKAERSLICEVRVNDPAQGGARYTVMRRALTDQAQWAETIFEDEVW